jgi:cysteinyl-tRNA synthetase
MAAAKASKDEGKRTQLSEEKLDRLDELRAQFDAALSDDMNMPKAIAVGWEVIKSNIPGTDKYELLLDFDTVLGLGLDRTDMPAQQDEMLPEDVLHLVGERDLARGKKDFAASDALRLQIEAKGFSIEDTPTGSQVKKKF